MRGIMYPKRSRSVGATETIKGKGKGQPSMSKGEAGKPAKAPKKPVGRRRG